MKKYLVEVYTGLVELEKIGVYDSFDEAQEALQERMDLFREGSTDKEESEEIFLANSVIKEVTLEVNFSVVGKEIKIKTIGQEEYTVDTNQLLEKKDDYEDDGYVIRYFLNYIEVTFKELVFELLNEEITTDDLIEASDFLSNRGIQEERNNELNPNTSLEDLLEGITPIEIARMIYFGDIKSFNDDYFFIDSYGNVSSWSESKRQKEFECYRKEIIFDVIENEFICELDWDSKL